MGVIQITDWRINGFNPDYAIKFYYRFQILQTQAFA